MKNKNQFRVLTILSVLFVLVIIYIFGFLSPIRERVNFNLGAGASVSSVARELKSQNLIYSENIFKASVLMWGGGVQKGGYDIPKGAGTWRIARMMARGDIVAFNVTIQEGLTVKQIIGLLNETVGLTDGGVMAEYKDGELFPDTYRVQRGASREIVLDMAKKKMDSIRAGWENSGRKMPSPLRDWNQVITLASIIQKETPRVDEMPIVASVYLNRLRKKMKLQADPTVVYAITDGLGDMRGAQLFTGHLRAKHPFNTYVNFGLPPAPIANVGAAAISAVLNPADTNYLFFVADGRGGHIFSRTYEEHQQHHNAWRKIRKAINSK